MKRDIKFIALDRIKLDQENVRFGSDVAQSQREALELLMADRDEAKKILRLAEHIAENGLDPTELQLVFPTENNDFIVIEGNRRLTALKLLQKPDLCPDEKLVRFFIEAQRKLKFIFPSEVEFSVVQTRAAGDKWIELKHTGQNGGVGRVNWDSDIRDERRARQTGVESSGSQIRKIIKDNPAYFSPEIAAFSEKIPVTTLTRLFSSKPAQDLFLIKNDNQILKPQISLEFIAPSVEFAIQLFAEHDYNVNDIRSKEDRQLFMKNIPEAIHPIILAENNKSTSLLQPTEINPTTIPQENTTTTAPLSQENTDSKSTVQSTTPSNIANGVDPTIAPALELPTAPIATTPTTGLPQNEVAPSNPSETINNIPQDQPPPASTGSQTRAKPSSKVRKYILNWPLNISNSRINEIYRELRHKLLVEEFPNATAISFRVFLEVSCDHVIEQYRKANTPILRADNAKPISIDDSLSIKIKSVITQLFNEKRISQQEQKALIKRATSHDAIGSVDHFNRFIHSAASAPIPSELKDIADEYRPLLEAIWK